MLRKKYVKSRRVGKVTFQVPKAELPGATEPECIYVAGDFNNWDPWATPMKRGKKSVYQAVVELEPGQAYQFRYVVNGEQWCNDWHADDYIPNGLGEDNCVVVAPAEDGS